MPDRAYTKRELDMKFTSLEEKVEASAVTAQEKNDSWNATIVKQNTQILEQVKHTNGRLRKVESWRMYMLGGMSILSVIGLYLGQQVLQNSSAISAIEAQLSIITKGINRTPTP